MRKIVSLAIRPTELRDKGGVRVLRVSLAVAQLVPGRSAVGEDLQRPREGVRLLAERVGWRR